MRLDYRVGTSPSRGLSRGVVRLVDSTSMMSLGTPCLATIRYTISSSFSLPPSARIRTGAVDVDEVEQLPQFQLSIGPALGTLVR